MTLENSQTRVGERLNAQSRRLHDADELIEKALVLDEKSPVSAVKAEPKDMVDLFTPLRA